MNRSIEDRAREYGKICKHIDCQTCELQDDCVWRFQYLAYKDGATQQKQIDIDKVYQWIIRTYLGDYCVDDNGNGCFGDSVKLADDLLKYMEENL